jgi:hypothetical protein
MATARELHAATLLSNGTVLVDGGVESSGLAASSAELYDPVANSWSLTGSLPTALFMATATLLPSGAVLVAGGNDWFTNLPIQSAEMYC